MNCRQIAFQKADAEKWISTPADGRNTAMWALAFCENAQLIKWTSTDGQFISNIDGKCELNQNGKLWVKEKKINFRKYKIITKRRATWPTFRLAVAVNCVTK